MHPRLRRWVPLLLLTLLGAAAPAPARAEACLTAANWQQAFEQADVVLVADVRSVKDVGPNYLVTVSKDYDWKAEPDGRFAGSFFSPKGAPPLYPGGTYALPLLRVGNQYILPACAGRWEMPPPSVPLWSDLDTAVGRLMDAGVLVGDGPAPHWDAPLTRAEAVVLLVRAAGLVDAARAYAGAPPWPDLQGHWAAGFVAVARDQGWVKGESDAAFAPDRPLLNLELLTLVERFLGLRPAPGRRWPFGEEAIGQELGLIQKFADEPWLFPSRGSGVQFLDHAFLSIPAVGRTVYQRLVQHSLHLSVQVTPGAAGVSVQGSAPGAAVVFVAGAPVAVDSAGQFATVATGRPVQVLAEGWAGTRVFWQEP